MDDRSQLVKFVLYNSKFSTLLLLQHFESSPDPQAPTVDQYPRHSLQLTQKNGSALIHCIDAHLKKVFQGHLSNLRYTEVQPLGDRVFVASPCLSLGLPIS